MHSFMQLFQTVTKITVSSWWLYLRTSIYLRLLNKKVEFMPGIIGMLVNRIKSGLNLKVFKLIVGSIVSSCMNFGMIPAYAAFAQNTLGGGGLR